MTTKSETVYQRVLRVTVDKLSVPESKLSEINESTKFVDDLDADSLAIVELVMGFEDEFSTPDKAVEINDEDVESIVTIKDAVDYLKKKEVKD